MNLESEQIVAGTQQCNLEKEIESAERKPGLQFSITIFKFACVGPNKFTTGKENTKKNQPGTALNTNLSQLVLVWLERLLYL